MIKEMITRRSTRSYNGKPVDKELVMQLLEAARLAPSGKNTQPWNFIVVTDPATKEKIAVADHNQMWMVDAPVHIVCVADIKRRNPDIGQVVVDENAAYPELKAVIRDTAVAIQHILLMAEHLGLASCWTGWYAQDDMRPILGIPNDQYVVGVVTIGHTDDPPKAQTRRDLEDMVRYEKW
ncbi:MAG: nitroreductase family protein [Defluviitaleaceae bacterium]|nr:nitroreductase family protein [Defluviitaleaceae bacterium]